MERRADPDGATRRADGNRLLVWALSALLLYAALAPGPGVPAAAARRRLPIYSVLTDERKLAISFDAAWGADKTPRILDTLDRFGVKTTFFLVSFWVRRYPDAARDIVRRGHELGMHSATHPDLTTLSDARIREEVMDNFRVIQETTGFMPRLFRPPFGAYDDRVLRVIEDELGFTVIQWSVDSLDWKRVGPEFVTRRVLERVHPGAIVLFHNNADATPAALPVILQTLQEQGWQVVPISQLLHPGEYDVDHEGRQVPRQGPPPAGER